MLRSIIFTGVAGAVLFTINTPADAETRLLELPSRYLVIPPSSGGARHLNPGDTVLDVPLRWRRAAVLSQAVEVAADRRHLTFPEGQSLAETRLQFDDPKFAQAASFCVARLADPLRKNPLLGGLGVIGAMLARTITDGQFCLVDSDRDGQMDHSVLVNAGSPAARTPVPIPAVPYVLTPGAAVGEGDSFKLTYDGAGHLEIAITEQGYARRFDTLTFVGPAGKSRYDKYLRVVKMPDGSLQIPAPGVVFNVKNYDKATRSMDVNWPATAQAVALPIPDVVRESNGFSY